MSIVRLSRLGVLVGVVLVIIASCKGGEHFPGSPLTKDYPRLILTKAEVQDIKNGIEKYPLLSNSFLEIKTSADKAIHEGVVVPLPADPGGGYTHEQHKRNYKAMYNAGIVYQVNGEEKYADFVKSMLTEYANMYPKLGIHPHKKNQAPGKLFWQGLNESVWLVYTIQAYDCIYSSLTIDERKYIEDNLFRKVVEFFTIEDSYSFNRVHNHGTWSAAGVGMTGMVLNDSNYVQMALYGTDKSGDAGYLKQIDQLFSPDGFYAEGPYYQRYAIHPFILFAQALENYNPDIKIFEFKGGVLNKAVETLLQLTSESGKFFPLNDAIKSKDYLSPELVFATNIAYANTTNPELLSIAKKHGKVMLSGQGLKVARDIEEGKSVDFNYVPTFISDGPEGDQGGIAILRKQANENSITVMLKATSQGMGHGHFDRLSFLMYENGEEIIQDYGAARFLNIEQKHGGRYLPENKTWAKQTVAHNTVVINKQSNFNGNLKEASKYHPEVLYTEFNNDDVQIIAVADSQCYQPTILQRTMALVSYKNSPFVIDLFRVSGDKPSVYDLPLYFQGQVITTNFRYNASEEIIHVMKGDNGYQHLWNLAHSKDAKGTSSVTWKNGNRFYTYSTLLNDDSEIFFTKIGANDPEFNLRSEPGLLVRQNNAQNHSFLSVIEAHGKADPLNETVEGTKSNLKEIKLLFQNEEISVVSLVFADEAEMNLFISHASDEKQNHSVSINGVKTEWTGNYYYRLIKQ